MKSTGIVRKMDTLGRVVIPMELRRTMGIAPDDSIEVFTDDDKIILRKYNPGCALCGGMDDLKTVGTLALCPRCLVKFREAIK